MSIGLFGPELALTAAATGISGIVTVASSIQKDARGHRRMSEPTFSIGLALTYLPIAYGIAAFRPLARSDIGALGLCLSYPILVHLVILASIMLERRNRSDDLLSIRGVSRARINQASVYVSQSPEDYRRLIVPAEARARRIDRLPKRLSVMFKSPQTVALIARQRFGQGSTSLSHYMIEHEERTREFFAALQSGMKCREIYSKQELCEYVRSGLHGASVRLPADHLIDNINRWVAAIEAQPNYSVALTDERLPFKYEVIDETIVVVHEAIGANDRDRLNGIAIEGQAAVLEFQRDFDTIWDRVAVQDREKLAVVRWVRGQLLPITQPSP